MKTSNKSVFLLIIFFHTIITAQEMIVPNNTVRTYNENEKIYMFSNSKIFEYEPEKNKIVNEIEFKNINYDIEDFTIVKANKKFFFIQNTGGVVLEIINDTLKRIDKSFNHKMQITSSIFTNNNEIFRYGGYGFFGARELITKYDFESNEWEAVKINGKINPVGRFDNAHFVKNNNLYIIGGTSVNKFDREKRVKLNDIWKFSFNEYSWERVLESEEIKKIDSRGFEFDENIFFRDDNEIKIFNVKTNILNIYEINSTFLKSFQKFKPHFYKNKFSFVVNRNNGERVMISRSENEILSRLKETKILKNEFININTIIILISILIIFLLIYSYRKYTSTVSLSFEKIKYKSNYIFISEVEYLVLKEFINNRNILENNILQNIVDKKQYDRSHNIRRKNNLISTLNTKFQYLFNKDYNYIEVQKSEYDKRYKRYFLNLYKLNFVYK